VSSTAPGGGPRGEILRSNVDDARGEEPAPKSRPAVAPFVLGFVLVFVLGVAAALLVMSAQSRPQQATAAAAQRIAPTAVPAASISGGLPDINGISCDALEGTVAHVHVHLAIFVNGQEQPIPYGIGIGQPWSLSDSDEGPFVDDGSCFYWIHTHTQDGIIHIESPIRRRFTLADFFAIWQMPLSDSQVGPAQGQVITYVNGQRSTLAPQDVPLLSHARIQLDVGDDVPPYPFDFPDGD
jgi:hypothetical protein